MLTSTLRATGNQRLAVPGMVLELMSGGSLEELLNDHDKPLSWYRDKRSKHKMELLLDCARGIEHLHSRSIIHRDIKSANCLLTIDWQYSVCCVVEV